MSHFGATFYPTGQDDYYYPRPEVIAPSPQRVMPEVPHQMQADLHRLELEARSVDPRRDGSQPMPGPGGPQHGREPSLNTRFGQQYQQPKPGQPATDYSPASNYSPYHENENNTALFDQNGKDMRDLPSFSPFPKVKGEHIPPSDEEKEAVLAESRQHVLHSNDPSMQICWARDVLSYVEISAEAAVREAEALRGPGERETMRPGTPKIEHELRMDAVNIVTYLAEQGHPEAVFIRSKWLEFGKFGKRQDKKEAYLGYTAAAQHGWGRAEYRIGMLYENSNDVSLAIQHYNKGLALKDSAASYRLGMISLMGQHGQYKDMPRGLELIHSAADTADEDAPQGAFVYGMIIARDLPDVNIPQGVLSSDLGVARQYIEKAAYLGFAKAQLKMGQAYELCQLSCDFNPALSLHYYGLAARQGQPEACLGVSRWFLFGYEGTFAKNEQLAYKYAQLAAKAKLPTGEFAMGYYNEIGIYVEKDLREARRWYELAADHGNKDALQRIEGLSQSKTLSKTDHETTALSRVKSQHGSQRGKRPDRFKQNNPLPPLAEGSQRSPRDSPRVSPNPSPRSQTHEHADMPDPSLTGTGGRPPAFTVNLPDRPKSAAPYPEDDRPAPLNLARPKSTAPYPEDDMSSRTPQLAPQGSHFNPGIRPSADHSTSAFAIRSQSPGQQGIPGPSIRQSQSGGNLGIPPAGVDPNRGRPVSASASWAPQVQGGRGQMSAYDQRPPSGPHGGYNQRPAGAGGPAPNNPSQNRLTKTNPNIPPPGQFPPGGYGAPAPIPANPGRDYGTRPAPRPASNTYSGRPSGAGGMTSPTMSGGIGPGPRSDSMASMGSMGTPGLPPGPRPASARPGPGPGPITPGIPRKDPPMDYGMGPAGSGRASAPPAKIGSPTPTINSMGSAMSAPAQGSAPQAKPKPVKSGPATFDEMGIPQGKKEDECVVM